MRKSKEEQFTIYLTCGRATIWASRTRDPNMKPNKAIISKCLVESEDYHTGGYF